MLLSGLQRNLCDRAILSGRYDKNSIPACCLRSVEGFIRGREKGHAITLAQGLGRGNTNTDRHDTMRAAFVRYSQGHDGVANSLGDDLSTCQVGLRERDSKLLATMACGNVAGTPEIGLKCFPNGTEHFITLSVTVPVVEALETVGVYIK